MTIRTSSKFVIFNHPFEIGSLPEVQPAGSYQIDIDEEMIEGLSFVAYKRVLTVIHLHSKNKLRSLTRALTISAKDLETALQKDKTKSGNILQDLHIDYQFSGYVMPNKQSIKPSDNDENSLQTFDTLDDVEEEISEDEELSN